MELRGTDCGNLMHKVGAGESDGDIPSNGSHISRRRGPDGTYIL